MYPIIEKGFLYIAQPPLYKVKKNKKERYLKNEAELSEYLLTSGLDGVSVTMGGKKVNESAIIPALRAGTRLTSSIARLSRRFYPEVIRSLVKCQMTPETIKNKSNIEKFVKDVETRIKI